MNNLIKYIGDRYEMRCVDDLPAGASLFCDAWLRKLISDNPVNIVYQYGNEYYVEICDNCYGKLSYGFFKAWHKNFKLTKTNNVGCDNKEIYSLLYDLIMEVDNKLEQLKDDVEYK